MMPSTKFNTDKDELVGFRTQRSAMNVALNGDENKDGVRKLFQLARAEVKHTGDEVPKSNRDLNTIQTAIRPANFPATEADQIEELRKAVLDLSQMVEAIYNLADGQLDFNVEVRRILAIYLNQRIDELRND
jgi:hypothetical protein